MSCERVLTNVLTFINILKKSNTCEVKSWDLETFKNAVSWGSYCKQMSLQATGKTWAQNLDNKLQELGMLYHPTAEKNISLDFLAASEEHLLKILLQNGALPSHLYREVLLHLSKRHSDLSLVLCDQTIAKSKHEILRDSTGSAETFLLYGKLLYESFHRALENSRNKTRTINSLKSIVDHMVADDPDKMINVLVGALCHPGCGADVRTVCNYSLEKLDLSRCSGVLLWRACDSGGVLVWRAVLGRLVLIARQHQENLLMSSEVLLCSRHERQKEESLLERLSGIVAALRGAPWCVRDATVRLLSAESSTYGLWKRVFMLALAASEQTNTNASCTSRRGAKRSGSETDCHVSPVAKKVKL